MFDIIKINENGDGLLTGMDHIESLISGSKILHHQPKKIEVNEEMYRKIVSQLLNIGWPIRLIILPTEDDDLFKNRCPYIPAMELEEFPDAYKNCNTLGIFIVIERNGDKKRLPGSAEYHYSGNPEFLITEKEMVENNLHVWERVDCWLYLGIY